MVLDALVTGYGLRESMIWTRPGRARSSEETLDGARCKKYLQSACADVQMLPDSENHVPQRLLLFNATEKADFGQRRRRAAQGAHNVR